MAQAIAPNLKNDSVKSLTGHIIDQASKVILGKDHQLSLALACLLARGHILIEDLAKPRWPM